MTAVVEPFVQVPRGAEGRPVLLRIGTLYERTIKVQFAPVDVAVAPDGTAYVLIRSNETRRNSPRTYFEVIPPGGEGGEADKGGPALVPVLDGERLRAQDPRLPTPVMCVLSDDGRLYSTDEHANVVVATRTSDGVATVWGEPGDGPGELKAPSGIALDSGETVWVVNARSHRVQRFTKDGRYLSGFGELGPDLGQFRYPWGLACDPYDESLLVADWGNNRVQRFAPDGTLLQVVGPTLLGLDVPLKGPSGVSVDQHGDVYITDRCNDRVVMVNHRGVFVETFIGDALMPQPAIARLMQFKDMLRRRDYVVGIQQERRLFRPISARPDAKDRLYIADTQRQRIQVYQKVARRLGPDEVAPAEGLEDPIVFM